MKAERVTRHNRCPICDSDSWCLIVGDSALCMRVASDRPHAMSHGTGFWHNLNGNSSTPRRIHKEASPSQSPHLDAPALIAKWQRKTTSEQLAHLACHLGVKASALMELQACYAEEHKAWAFPMRDSFGNIVGIRLRNYLGHKWAVTGSTSGIFLPLTFRDKVAVCVEGPTDSCAVLSLGMMPIGRPSASGGVVEIIKAIGRWKIFKVLIISDNDRDHKRPDGKTFNPGLDGALALQAQLPVPSCLVMLPCKDIRDFVKAGATSTDLSCIANSMDWKYPTTHEHIKRRTIPQSHARV
jgi:hypothetical protein